MCTADDGTRCKFCSVWENPVSCCSVVTQDRSGQNIKWDADSVVFFDGLLHPLLSCWNSTLSEPQFPWRNWVIYHASYSFTFPPSLLSVQLIDLKGVMQLHGYLGAWEGQAAIPAWRDWRLDRLQTSPWLFSPPETPRHRQRANHTVWNPRTQTFWKSFPIWWGNRTPVACWTN